MKKTPKNKPGPPPVAQDDPKFSLPSMAAAAEHIGGGCTPEMLKAAKQAGAPGFRSTRIYPAELTEWLKNNPIDMTEVESKQKYQIMKLREEFRRLERENKKAEGELISLAEQIEICAKLDGDILRAIDESLGEALKHRLIGAGTYPDVNELIEGAKDRIRSQINALVRNSPPT